MTTELRKMHCFPIRLPFFQYPFSFFIQFCCLVCYYCLKSLFMHENQWSEVPWAIPFHIRSSLTKQWVSSSQQICRAATFKPRHYSWKWIDWNEICFLRLNHNKCAGLIYFSVERIHFCFVCVCVFERVMLI